MKGLPRSGKRKISLRLRLELLEDRQLLAGGVVAASFGAAASIPLVSVVGSQQPAEQETVSAPARFGSEADLRQYLIDQAVNQWKYYLGAHFPNYDWWFYGGGGIVSPLAQSNAVTAGEVTNFIGNSVPSPTLNSGFSQTNVQVSGVDEADQVKTDGQYIYLLADQKLEILRALPATDLAVVSHTWIEGQALGLFLVGDRLAVISSVYDYQKYSGSQVKITLFDVSDATNPKVVQETYMSGWYVTSRAIGNKVYVVLQSSFNIPVPQFQVIDNERVYETEAAYRARLAAMPLEAMLPEIYTRSNDPFGPLQEGGPLVDPSNLYQPISSDANELLSVAAFDVTSSNPCPIDKVSILSPQATTVYASEDNFYVISAPWCSDPNSVVSTIEKISLAGNKLDLTATGEVPGLILNQYSVDESNGYLRIATNVGHGITSKANLYILADEGGTLTIVGRLEDLVPGERVTAARFAGSHGFLFTTLMVDPLVIVDLSDAANPRVLGELTMPGFSEYFQFIDENHLVALGRDGSHKLEVSLFDVSDFSAPVLVDQYLLGANDTWVWSQVEYDSHAFGYYPEFHTLAIPFAGSTPNGFFDSELVVLQVDDAAGFHLLGMATQTDAIVRSLRIEDMLYSLSDKSIQVQSIDNPRAEISSVSTVILDVPRNATGTNITPNPGREFAGSVATIRGTDPTNLNASINWGDASSFSYATITANGDGTFSVIGSHTYLQEGHYSITVSLTNPDGSLQVQGTAVVTRAPDQTPVAPDATGSTFTINFDDSLIDTGVTFTTSDPSKIHAMVDWFGGGSFVEGTVVPNGKGAFTVQRTEPDYYPVFWVGAAIVDGIAYYRLAPGSHDITVILYDGSGLPTVVHSTVIVNAPPPITGGGGCGDDNPPAPPPAVSKVETPAPTPAPGSSVNFLPPLSQALAVASGPAPASTSSLPRPTIITAGLEPATSLNSPAGSGLGTPERGTNGMDSVGPADIGLSEDGLKEKPSDGLKGPLNFDVVLPNWPAPWQPLGSSQTDQGSSSEDRTVSDFQPIAPTVESLQLSDGVLEPESSIFDPANPQAIALGRGQTLAGSRSRKGERPGDLGWSQEMLGSLLILSLPSLEGQNNERTREKREE